DSEHKGIYKYCGPPIGRNPQMVSAISSDFVTADKNTFGTKVYPNPFSTSTTISFSLSQQQKVSIQIFDATGRLAKTLANAEMQSGTHQFTWNARDEKGNHVIAGIYFLRMNAGVHSETKKLVVAK